MIEGATISIASIQQYVLSLIDGMSWPAAMTNLPSLAAWIMPPDPNVDAATPTAYIWMARGDESRRNDALSAGTVPRINVPGGPSGTKLVRHQVPVWLKYNVASNDPDADNLLPGMVWQIMAVFRSAAFGAGGTALAQNPVKLTDPYTGEQSWLIDIGEDMRYEIFDRALAPQALLRLDGVIDLSLAEVIAA